MKAGWQESPIGEVFRVVNGGTPKTGVAAYWDGPHAWITPAEMGGLETPLLSGSRRTLTDEGLRVGAELVPEGSIILSTRAPIGHLVINEVPMAFNQGCKGLVPSTGVDTKFAYYFLLANVPLLESLGTGATFKELSGGKLKEVPFRFPELSEQRRIVAILDEAFDGIATAKAHAERNLRNAREVFEIRLEQIFVDPDVVWRTEALDSIGVTQTGSTPKTSERENYGAHMPFVKPGDFNRDGTIGYENEGLSEVGVRKARLVAAGSTLMVCIGATIGKAGYTEREVTTNQQVNAWTPTGAISGKLVYYQMISKDFQRRVREGAGQATLPIINKSKWSALTVLVPQAPEDQNRIVEELDTLQADSMNLEDVYQRKLAALDELKQSLLHQAFSGRLSS